MDSKEEKGKNEINKELSDLPKNIARLIRQILDENSYPENHNSRIALVEMGKKILPYMYKLLGSENDRLRIEATKIVELIADRGSVKMLIGLLDDSEFEVRWIASEGLIKIGRISIPPLLRLIRDGKGNYYINHSVHHILINLLYEKEKKELSDFLLSLENYHELGETAPVGASRALTLLFKCKN